MTYEMASEAETMCNLSDGVEKRGIAESNREKYTTILRE